MYVTTADFEHYFAVEGVLAECFLLMLWLHVLFSLQVANFTLVRVCAGLHDPIAVLQPCSLGSRDLSHSYVYQLRTGACTLDTLNRKNTKKEVK